MPRISQAPFDAGQQFVARRAFLAGGVSFIPGAPFPVTDLRLTRRLYEQRFIQAAHAERPPQRGLGYRVVRRTLGWYDVLDPAGKKINDGALRQSEAETLRAAAEQKEVRNG